MTTAIEHIKRSMRLLQVYSIGEEPSADEAQTGLTALNTLMETLPNARLNVFNPTTDVVNLIANQTSFTIGPSGTTVSDRPVQLQAGSFIAYQGISYPLEILNKSDFNAIQFKAQAGMPSGVYMDATFPDATVYIWPTPFTNMTLNLVSTKQMQAFPTLTTDTALPLGYNQMIPFLLAEVLGPEFDVPIPTAVMKEAQRIKRDLKRVNAQVPRLKMPSGMPVGGETWAWRY